MSEKSLKYLFIVQGEGRGHMTQAISLQEILTRAGHKVTCVLVGKSQRREIPSFFYEKIKAPVFSFESPNFIVDSKNKSVKIVPTILYNLKRLGFYLDNLKKIDKKVKEYEPDVIVNFYDLLSGLYFLLYNPKVKYICVGHQYLLLHPKFEFPKKKVLEKWMVQFNTQMTSFRADKKLALSFREFTSDQKQKISVVPPLLRKEIMMLESEDKPYLLAYMVNDGYSEEIINWHKNHPEVEMHCFWDKKGVNEEHQVHHNLVFHKINDVKFLEFMKGCKGYASTAGFESICEAMYLGKPILMVPTSGQFEQECNALDAYYANAGIYKSNFDLSSFIDYIPKHRNSREEFQDWVKKADAMFLAEMN